MNATKLYRGSAIVATENDARRTEMMKCLEERGLEVRAARDYDEIAP